MEDLIKQLRSDDLVLTVNRRLAGYLRSKYDSHQLLIGKNAWSSPSIIPLSTWLKSQAPGYVLPDSYAEIVWQNIISKSDAGAYFICAEQAAKQAFAAWRLVQEYNIEIQKISNSSSDAVLAWLAWADEYEKTLIDNQWLDSATCLSKVAPVQQPGQVFSVGFDRFSPQTESILKKLNVIEVKITTQKAPIKVVSAQNIEHELAVMVEWASEHRDQKIACIVPNINDHYFSLKSLFRERGLTANIVAAVPLSQYAIVSAALVLLKLCTEECDFSELSTFYRSPFFDANYKKDFKCRDQCVPNIVFSEFETFAQAQSAKQSARAWASYFSELLSYFHWPGKRVLNSEELQAKQQFENLLSTFANTEILSSKTSQFDALQDLRYLANNAFFQPQSDETNIQVLGLLETAGLQFDAIWVMNMDDETLPQALSPNPFLPVKLQRDLHMPRANDQSECRYGKQMIERLQQSTESMVVSYSLMDNDRELSVSPFFADIIAEERPLTAIKFSSLILQKQKDEQAPKVSEHEKIRGGSYILKAQAACPFKAFAEIRLGAYELPELTSGVTPMDRGNFVHAVLEKIWLQLSSHADLVALDEQQLSDCVDRHLEKTFERIPASPIIQIEKKRIKKVVVKWLRYEKSRAPFSVIGVEEKQEFTIAGLSMTLRLDRVDQLADNSHAIIDYKTGKTSINDWFGDRPLEPQMPLYCLANGNINTISFASVRMADCSFSGISDAHHLIPDTKPTAKFADNWSELTLTWQNALTRLVENFLGGDAKADPKNGALTCQYCACPSLCRIQI